MGSPGSGSGQRPSLIQLHFMELNQLRLSTAERDTPKPRNPGGPGPVTLQTAQTRHFSFFPP